MLEEDMQMQMCKFSQQSALLTSLLTFWRLKTTIVVLPHRYPLNVSFDIFIQQI